jgi:Protein of unknown function (DUF3891)
VIVRSTDDQLLLITQPDHAALAARIIAAWRRDSFPAAPRRDSVLLATREHDNGWLEEDRSPIVDPASGRILDFVGAPDAVRQRIWPRAVERLRHQPYAAALVAEHAVSVFERYRRHQAWLAWFAQMEAARDEALESAAPLTYQDLRRDYFFVAAGDLASLTFCNAWPEPQHAGEYTLTLDGGDLVVYPDPFDGHAVPLTIAARRLPNRLYVSEIDASSAFEAGEAVTVTGTAVGASESSRPLRP